VLLEEACIRMGQLVLDQACSVPVVAKTATMEEEHDDKEENRVIDLY
jgi:hypothetical protein